MGGKKPSVKQTDALDPAQRQALEQILGFDLGPLFDPQRQQEFFQAQVADPTLKQFQEQILPAIQEEFVGAGAASSSGLNRALATAASDLQGTLAGQLSAFQQQGQQNQLNALLAALGKPAVQNVVDPGKPGLGGPIGSVLGAGLGLAVPGIGPTLGAGLGGTLGGSF